MSIEPTLSSKDGAMLSRKLRWDAAKLAQLCKDTSREMDAAPTTAAKFRVLGLDLETVIRINNGEFNA